MEMTKQRKMLIGILCLGLGGVVVDRLLLSRPESAAADDTIVVVDAPPTAEPVTDDVPPPQAAGNATKTLPSYEALAERLVLAQQLEAADAQVTDREDPFALPAQWQADDALPPTTSDAEVKALTRRINDLFKLDGTVRSVIDGKEELLAVISGGGLDSRSIRVGQKIRITNSSGPPEEYVLVEVGARYVEWKSVSTQEKIKMQVEEVL